MRQIDYDIGWNFGKAVITARSDRAKQPTANRISVERDAALELVRRDEAQGYSFLRHELIDKNRPCVRNGYFVIGPGGQLILLVGQDWGPSWPVYQEGDTLMGEPRNAKEAQIERFITGDFARRMGFGVWCSSSENAMYHKPIKTKLRASPDPPPLWPRRIGRTRIESN